MLVRSYSEKESQLKKRTKQPSDKDILFEKVQGLFEKSNSIAQLKQYLKAQGIKTYQRAGKLTGVFYGKRKYRFKQSLGIDINQLRIKNKVFERGQTLRILRNQKEKLNDLTRER